jgi:hypothetical protein
VAVDVVARQDRPAARRSIAQSLEERGVPLRALRLVAHPSELQHPLPLRCDLRETGFSGPVGVVGPANDVSAETRQPTLAAV